MEPAPLVVDAVEAVVGGDTVRRSLPTRRKRTIGAWCFLDHYGPRDVEDGAGMAVGPHPHIGLQTVTWLVEGRVVHADSLGNRQVIRPGQLNVMTAGRGIAHAEISPERRLGVLHGTQLWLALPDGHRRAGPAFAHHPDLPVTTSGLGRWEARVQVGRFAGVASPALVHSPVVGVELSSRGPAIAELPLDPAFEHGLVVLAGAATLRSGDRPVGAAGRLDVGPDRLVVEPPGRSSWSLATDRPTRALLLGGTPWAEPLVMWWNFVGVSGDEIAAAREDWELGRRFGETPFDEVPGVTAPRLAAPPLIPGRLISRT